MDSEQQLPKFYKKLVDAIKAAKEQKKQTPPVVPSLNIPKEINEQTTFENKENYEEQIEQIDVPEELPTQSAKGRREVDERVNLYLKQLQKESSGEAKPLDHKKEEELVEKNKNQVDTTIQSYVRRILELGSGGGSVAVQYANGGTMN